MPGGPVLIVVLFVAVLVGINLLRLAVRPKWTRRFEDSLQPAAQPPAPAPPEKSELPEVPAPREAHARPRNETTPSPVETPARRPPRTLYGAVALIALVVAGGTLASDPNLASDKVRFEDSTELPYGIVVTNIATSGFNVYVQTRTGTDSCVYSEFYLNPGDSQAFGPEWAARLLDQSASSNCDNTRGRPVGWSQVCVGYCNVDGSQVYIRRQRIRHTTGMMTAGIAGFIGLLAGIVFLRNPLASVT